MTIIKFLPMFWNPQKKKTAPQPKPKCRNYHIALNSRCVTGFVLLLISSSFRAFSNSSIRLSSSSASSSPKCVYVLSVTPMSLCPIRYYSVFGFMPDFAMFDQYVWRHICGVMLGSCMRYISLYRFTMWLNRCSQCIATNGFPLSSKNKNPV